MDIEIFPRRQTSKNQCAKPDTKPVWAKTKWIPDSNKLKVK